MKTFYVLYDVHGHRFGEFAYWLSRQPAFAELKFIPLPSPEVACRFPGLEKFLSGEPLLVVSDTGAVYQGPGAWIMCLYALRHHREGALLLAHPELLPFARPACELICRNRLRLSRWLGKEERLAERMREMFSAPEGNTTLPQLLAKKHSLNS